MVAVAPLTSFSAPQQLNGALSGSNVDSHHARSSRFSTHLAGRFYRNSTLEAHASRKKRAARMRAKKRELENAILIEERKAELLKEVLRERKKQCLAIQKKRMSAAITIQCLIRKQSAELVVRRIRKEKEARNRIASFCQVRHRGGKGRVLANKRKEQVDRLKKEQDACIRIQSIVRSHAAKKIAEAKQEELHSRQNMSATTMQSVVRMHLCKMDYNCMLKVKRRQMLERQHASAILIQSIHRRNMGKKILAEKQRRAIKVEEAKPKRLPLHMRRYSTYSVSTVAAVAVSLSSGKRRSSVIGLTTPTPTQRASHNNYQRRQSCQDKLKARHSTDGTGSSSSTCSTPIDNTANRNTALVPSKRDQTPSTHPPSISEDEDDSTVSSKATTSTTSSSSSMSAKLREARKRAAARVALKGRQSRRQQNEKEQAALDAKARVSKLEEARRKEIKQKRLKKENIKKKRPSPKLVNIQLTFYDEIAEREDDLE